MLENVRTHSPYPIVPRKLPHHIKAKVSFETFAKTFQPACRNAAAKMSTKASISNDYSSRLDACLKPRLQFRMPISVGKRVAGLVSA